MKCSGRYLLQGNPEYLGRPPVWNIDIGQRQRGATHRNQKRFRHCDLGRPSAVDRFLVRKGLIPLSWRTAQMLYSMMTGKRVQLPMDPAMYEKHLKGLPIQNASSLPHLPWAALISPSRRTSKK